MSSPRDGWTLEQALALVAQGYAPAHVERLTGWNAKQLEAQLRQRVAQASRSPLVVTAGRWR